MGLTMFKKQIEKRILNDEKQFQKAFAELASVLDADFIRRGEDEAVIGAVADVLSSVGAKPAPVPEKVTDMQERLTLMLRPTGVMRRHVELKGTWWKDCRGSLLGSTKDGDVIAITKTKTGKRRYRDKTGAFVIINKETAKNIEVDAFCFYKPFPAREMSLSDLMRFMVESINLSDVFFLMGIILLVSVTGMLTPYFNRQLFNNVIPSGLKSNVLPMASLMVGVAIGTAMFGITRSLLLNKIRGSVNTPVRSAAMMRILSLPPSFFKDYTAGDLSNRLGVINNLCVMLINAVMSTGLTALFSLVYLFQMSRYAPKLVLPGFLIIIAMLSVSVIQIFFQLGNSRKIMRAQSRLSGVSFALLSGIQKIKLAGAQKRAFAKWAAAYAESAKSEFSPPMFIPLSSAISGMVSMFGVLWLYYLAGSSGIPAADYMAFSSAYGAVSGAIMALAEIISTVAQIKPMMEMIEPILKALPESAGGREMVRSLSGSIEVNGLTFRYDKDAPPVLDCLSLKIRSGEFVAVVGESGCGKSTLLRLLLGFETPERGSVYYDGKELSKLDLPSVRRRIGVCLQNGKLFAGDIFSNIIVTAAGATLEDAWRAAKMAGLDEDIKAMPMGMQTVIAEGGVGISGGQKQRLLIARAVVAMPKILFFDEATSALDNLTQKRVTESIASLKCTRLVIAHRLSTIQGADRIIVLDKGKIAEEGDYNTLIEKRGIFYALAKRQIL